MIKITLDLVGKNVIALHDFSGPLHYDENAYQDYVKKGSIGIIKRVDIDETLWVYFASTNESDKSMYWVFGDLEIDFSPT